MADLSKIIVLGQEYLIKDEAARTELSQLGTAAKKAYEDTLTAGNNLPTGKAVTAYVSGEIAKLPKFDVVIDTKSTSKNEPATPASVDTMYKLYLIPSDEAASGTYIEYITIRTGAPEKYTYAWEQIGNTKVNLTGYVPTSTTIAGVAIDHNITKDELSAADALDLKALAHKAEVTGTVAAKSVSGVTATGTPKGSIAVTLKDADVKTSADISREDYTPAGTISGTVTVPTDVTVSAHSGEGVAKYTPAGTISKPSITVTPDTKTIEQITGVGALPTVTDKTAVAVAKSGLVASVEGETLTFAAADTENALTGFTFNQGSLPTKASVTVASGTASATATAPVFTGTGVDIGLNAGSSKNITASFQGTAETGLKVSKVEYVKPVVDAAQTKFTGEETVSNVATIQVPSQEVVSK